MAGGAARGADRADALRRRRERATGAGDRSIAAARVPDPAASTRPRGRPIDSLAVGRLLAWRLAENHQAELVRRGPGGAIRHGRSAAARRAHTRRMRPTILGTAVAVARGWDRLPRSRGALRRTSRRWDPPPARRPVRELRRGRPDAPGDDWPRGLEWLQPGARRGNSNNFVVAGSRTASGRPLLANDPHLQIEFPGVWYEMHLVAAGLDVIGVSIPGHALRRPRSQRAHRVGDDQHRRRRAGPLRRAARPRRVAGICYQGQWLPIDVVRSRHPGARRAPASRSRSGARATARSSRRSASTGRSRRRGCRPAPSGRASVARLRLRWDDRRRDGGRVRGAQSRRRLERVHRRRRALHRAVAELRLRRCGRQHRLRDVRRAARARLGQRDDAAGRHERRAANGSDASIPSTLPRAFNPPARLHHLVEQRNRSAVDRAHHPRLGGAVSRDAAASDHRRQRDSSISGARRSAERCRRASRPSVCWRASTPRSTAVAQRAQAKSRCARSISLRVWDRRVDARPIVTLYHVFEDALWRRTFVDEMGEPLFDQLLRVGRRRAAGRAVRHPRRCRRRDGSTTSARSIGAKRATTSSCSPRATRSSASQREYGRQTPGTGRRFTPRSFAHPLGGAAFPLRWLFNRGPSPLSGDIYTVMRVSYNRLRPFAAWEIPSWRQLFDVGQWDDSRVVLPTGQSGHPLSPHYFDQNEMWRQGQYAAAAVLARGRRSGARASLAAT